MRLLLVGCLALAGLSVLPAARPALAQDAAELVVRLNRLEGQVRQLSGQIEQLQFENRQLKDQVRKFQEDVEFRFNERGSNRAPSPPTATTTPGSTPPQGRQPSRRGDAFDPNAAPNAPGAPNPLGTATPSGPLPGGAVAEAEEPGAGPLDLNSLSRTPAPPTPARPSVAATGSGNPRADYDAAYAYLLQKQYEQAEMAFRQFLQSHPRHALVPDAIFWVGETYLARNRHREAAEQFLKVSTEHARTPKAPDAMLKLGIALNAIGARDQACATFAELERKYPAASATVRAGVDREQKRARCAA